MLCADLNTVEPSVNLATEEYLLKNTSEEYFLLYVNDTSVIIGKNQVANREADTVFVARNHIPVIRRISGGGTVYHDYGNINYCLITNAEDGRQVDFRKNTELIIGFLKSIGINAVLEGKNDLRVNGYKISGNAEYVYRNRVLHHGTILFDADLRMMGNAIRKDMSCYDTKGVDSNPSKVMNLCNILPETDAGALKDGLFSWLLGHHGFSKIELAGKDNACIDKMAEKYKSWQWNYAFGPDYRFEKRFLYSGKTCRVEMSVVDGIIVACTTGGLPFSGQSLTGCRHSYDDLCGALESTGRGMSDIAGNLI